MRDGARHQASHLATTLGVSQRTLYRDIDRLRDAGLPIEGQRGVGYVMRAPVTLPPLDLTATEMEALELALSAIADAADAELREAAISLSGKIKGAEWGLAGRPGANAGTFRHLATLRAAIRAHQKVELATSAGTETVNPLLLDYRARAWILVAYSPSTGCFRDIAVTEIEHLRPIRELFGSAPGTTLSDYRKTARSGE